MGQRKNHYRTLGVDQDASMDEIKKAYKDLARKWHPDKNPNEKEAAEKKFKEISESYRILSDGKLRQDYDQDEELARFQEEMNKKRRHDAKIHRMAKEQEDYVRKQEARRARAHRSPSGDDYFTDFSSGAHETIFNNFFADREEWRRLVPDLFAHEPAFDGMMRDMNDLMRTAFRMRRDSHEGPKRTSHRRRFSERTQPSMQQNMDDVFNAFFSNSRGYNMAGFSY